MPKNTQIYQTLCYMKIVSTNGTLIKTLTRILFSWISADFQRDTWIQEILSIFLETLERSESEGFIVSLRVQLFWFKYQTKFYMKRTANYENQMCLKVKVFWCELWFVSHWLPLDFIWDELLFSKYKLLSEYRRKY